MEEDSGQLEISVNCSELVAMPEHLAASDGPMTCACHGQGPIKVIKK